MAKEASRPTVRFIHHLARSGGTVICKCLASMKGVALLSEVHPLVPSIALPPEFHPAIRVDLDAMAQAHRWYRLLTPGDVASVNARRRGGLKGIRFREQVELIERRCRERGLVLVLRDWSHLDFHGPPFVERAAGEPGAVKALGDAFRIAAFSAVRHPIDQWLSLEQLVVMRRALELPLYLRGCRMFAERARATGFVRYEDFTRDPDTALRAACAGLELPFDATYRDRWASYTNITGDVAGTRAQKEIKTVPRRTVSPEVIETFAASDDYRRTLDLLGYAHPEGIAS